jgi:hypothetical protein
MYEIIYGYFMDMREIAFLVILRHKLHVSPEAKLMEWFNCVEESNRNAIS